MGNSAPAKSSLSRERQNGKILTAAECLAIAERKMGEAIGDRRHGKELRATAQAWLVLAERIAQAEAIEALKAKGKKAFPWPKAAAAVGRHTRMTSFEGVL